MELYVLSDERLSVFLELERVTGVSLGEKKFARTPRKPPATNKGSCLAPKVVSHFSLVQPRKLSGLKARFNLPDQKGRLSLREGEGRVRVALSALCCLEGSTPHLPPSLCYGAAGNPPPLAKGRGETNAMGLTTGGRHRSHHIGLKSYCQPSEGEP